LKHNQGGASKKKEGNLTSTIASTFAFVAGIASLLDIERVDKTVDKQEDRLYAEIRTFAKRLRFGPLRKDILNGSGSSGVL
jgi:hypothetical protein